MNTKEVDLNIKRLQTMNLLQHYVIDWDKVKTQKDLITILKGLQLGFSNPSDDLKKLCRLVDKPYGQVNDLK